ncbi:carbohydrate esterase family 1 protein [Xylariaceae sp. FL0255]|nr:carbohydrate esterase family 1 protein [Xylariaceae sp. FL0255]
MSSDLYPNPILHRAPRVEMVSGLRQRRDIHLPSSYNVNTAMPLLIAYHGSGDTPANLEATTRFSDPSVNPNMVVVYPQGVNGNWEGPTYATPGVSDKVFTTDLVNHIQANYCIDTTRVYAAGHSNGGGFIDTLACSPGHGNGNCTLARSPLPVLESHGGANTTIPYTSGNGRGGPLPAIPKWLSRWATRDDCTSSTVTDLPNSVHHTVWTCKGTSGLLQHYKIDTHGHDWPVAGSEIDISPVIISFLSGQHYP